MVMPSIDNSELTEPTITVHVNPGRNAAGWSVVVDHCQKNFSAAGDPVDGGFPAGGRILVCTRLPNKSLLNGNVQGNPLYIHTNIGN